MSVEPKWVWGTAHMNMCVCGFSGTISPKNTGKKGGPVDFPGKRDPTKTTHPHVLNIGLIKSLSLGSRPGGEIILEGWGDVQREAAHWAGCFLGTPFLFWSGMVIRRVKWFSKEHLRSFVPLNPGSFYEKQSDIAQGIF